MSKITYTDVFNAFRSLGASAKAASFLTSQVAVETAVKGVPFNSPLIKTHYNPGGIMYVGQKNAVQGESFPKEEIIKYNNGKPAYYAKFNTLKDGLSTMYKIQRKNAETAENLTQFNNLTKAAGYYTADKNEYLYNLKYWYNKGINYFKDTGGGSILLIGTLFFLIYKIYNK